MKAIIILNYASEEDIGKKTSLRLRNEENAWIEEVVIKPMPQKKEEVYAEKYAGSTYVISYTGAHEISAKTHPLYADGWNACIDKITGETE